MKKENLLLTILATIALSACAQTPTAKVGDESSYYAKKGEHLPTTLQSLVQRNKTPETPSGKVVPTNIATPN